MSLVWGGAKSEDYQFVERDEIYVPDRCYAIWRPDLDGAGSVLREQLGYRPQSPVLYAGIRDGTDSNPGLTTGFISGGTISSSTDQAHSASRSLKFSTATLNVNVIFSDYVMTSNYFPAAPAQKWVLGCWGFTADAASWTLVIRAYNSTPSSLGLTSYTFSGSGAWELGSVVLTMPANTVWVSAYVVRSAATGSSKTVYLDDISLLRTDLSDANGAISGALWRQGPTGSVLRFDSVGDDFVKVTGDMIGTGAVSIEALVYLNGWGGGDIGRILDNGTCRLYIGNATQRKVNFVRSGASAATNLTELALGNWYHILMTCTLTGLTIIYVNGVSDRPAGLTYGAPAVGRDTYIGNRAEADRGFDGDIALLRLYDKALTAGEVYEAYRDVAPLAGLG